MTLLHCCATCPLLQPGKLHWDYKTHPTFLPNWGGGCVLLSEKIQSTLKGKGSLLPISLSPVVQCYNFMIFELLPSRKPLASYSYLNLKFSCLDTLVTFQILSSHMWQVAIMLHSADKEHFHQSVNLEHGLQSEYLYSNSVIYYWCNLKQVTSLQFSSPQNGIILVPWGCYVD